MFNHNYLKILSTLLCSIQMYESDILIDTLELLDIFYLTRDSP